MTSKKVKNCPFRNPPTSGNTVCRKALCALYIEEASRCALNVMGQAMLGQVPSLKEQNTENQNEC